MRLTVERFYRFRASHELKEFGIPRHEHDYTVGVTVEQADDADLFPTERLDSWWESTVLWLFDSRDLNEKRDDTTVEGLARWLLACARELYPQVVAVTVMEDQQRRGRAEV